MGGKREKKNEREFKTGRKRNKDVMEVGKVYCRQPSL